MADIRCQPGGSKKMNEKNKTSYSRGQLALPIYEKLYSQCCMKSAFAIANEE